jgi:hypothetical protein
MYVLSHTSSPKFGPEQVGVGGEAGEPAGLGDEGVPSVAGSIEHGGVVVEHAMREEALAQVEPDPLDRVETLWGGRRG